jgi:hypothetical protein
MLTSIMWPCLLLAEKMIDELLKVDAIFFKDFRYDDSTQNILASRENIDRWIYNSLSASGFDQDAMLHMYICRISILL